MRTLAATVAIFFCLAGVVRAKEDPVLSNSRDHYARGRALYLENHNIEALREFEAGFEEVPRPEFLINIGLCQLRLGHSKDARDAFRKFLAAAPEGHRQKKNVEELLRAAEAAMVHEQPESELHASPEPSVVSVPSPLPSVAHDAPVVAPVVSAPVTVTDIPPQKSFARRHWWIFPVVSVVVVGVAVGLGVGLTQPTGCAAQKGLCVDASR